MRVGLEHLGQSVLLLVSIIFLRSPVLAIFAIVLTSPVADLVVPARAPNPAAGAHPGRNRDAPGAAIRFPKYESKRKGRSEKLQLVYTNPGCERDRRGSALSFPCCSMLSPCPRHSHAGAVRLY